MVTKVAVGFSHAVVQLDNGDVYVSGNNSEGQLHMNPRHHPVIDGLVPHESINKFYEVVDVG